MRPLLVLALVGCSGGNMGPAMESPQGEGGADAREAAPPADPDAPPPISMALPPAEAPLGAASTSALVGFIAPILLGRDATGEELRRLEETNGEALAEILGAWQSDPGFARGARRFIERAVKVSGQTARGIDYGAPGRIVEHVATEGLPWSAILTLDGCVSESGELGECDTEAPYSAGILTTRSFLITTASRFNLGRASALSETFLCEDYPLSTSLEPHVGKEMLQPLFRANSAEELPEDADSVGGLTNGAMCYTCHGQFAPHAQLFVRFDKAGMYRAEATGLQDPDAEAGDSFGGLLTSHLVDELAAQESSQMLGQPVANLAEAAQVLGAHSEFRRCSVERLLEHTLPLAPGSLDHDVTTRIAVRLGEDATFADLIRETFSYPRVVHTLGSHLAAQGNPDGM